MTGRISYGADSTFDLVNCRDLLQKLERELDRIRQCDDREELADLGFNFAVTAWHLTDWVWADITSKHDLKVLLAARANKSASKFGLAEFRDWMRKLSEDLNHCRLIATASKHVGAERRPGDPGSFTATGSVSFSGGPTGAGPHGAAPHGAYYEKWVLKIIVNGERKPGLDVFDRVCRFWKHFIDDNKIGYLG